MTADQTVAAWRGVDLDGTVPGPGGTRCPPRRREPSPSSCRHGWDIAQGAGLELRVSDQVVAYVSTLADPSSPVGGSGRLRHEVSPLDCLRARPALRRTPDTPVAVQVA